MQASNTRIPLYQKIKIESIIIGKLKTDNHLGHIYFNQLINHVGQER